MNIVVAGVVGAAGASALLGQSGASAPPAPGSQAPSEPAAPVRAVHMWAIRLTGDLSSVRLVTRLREELDAASAGHAEIVVLSVEGQRWRAEVVRALADVVHSSKVPVAGLIGPAAHVGGGQVLVALGATTTWIAPRTTIESTPGDEVAFPAAAGGVEGKPPSAAGEIVRLRGLPPELASVLLAPSGPMYAAWGGPERKLELQAGEVPPGAPDAVVLVAMERSVARTTIPPDVAVRLGIAKGAIAEPGQILRALSMRAAKTTQRVINEDLTIRRTELLASVAAVRTLISQASDRMASSPRGDDPADQDKRRKNGVAAVSTLKRAGEALEKAEQQAKEYPELLIEPPPGVSTVGMTPEGSVKAWQKALQDMAGDLAKAGERAARAAESKK